MKIKRLVIENFKSIERIELIEPNPFTVFVGPNGSGKSNIFEALEFVNLHEKFASNNDISQVYFRSDAGRLYGGPIKFLNRSIFSPAFKFGCFFDSFTTSIEIDYTDNISDPLQGPLSLGENFGIGNVNFEEYQQFYNRYSRIFVGNEKLVKLPFNDNTTLSLSAKNLESVLKRILDNPILRNEIFEWLELFIPEFKNIEIITNQYRSEEVLFWYDQYAEKPFTKDLISDGTFNILVLLTAIYQSEEPQFLCIEEPENGLNPKVVRELVNLCRYACEEKGHFIWLNTHSQTLVSQLTPDEIILVDKKQGATQTKQIKGMNLHGLPMDEAWLSKVLGGGLPW
ncbi:AAA family ATPase [Larkinella sp. VNQ87]|uniref:AAA family ATPase n=1 Tax=Larkinella sp. VNQ87 TaxID=3400921 RepID=UPI003BFC82EB